MIGSAVSGRGIVFAQEVTAMGAGVDLVKCLAQAGNALSVGSLSNESIVFVCVCVCGGGGVVYYYYYIIFRF